ncbi:hypothetical protein J1614_009103 [Plenodomus biglobosus]|nr:hypothetical protein J1614_009103 [Plenodomus biglobosus]
MQFQKILALNLPFRTDRRDAMSLSAALSNIRLEFVDGVTGDSIHQKAYPPPDGNIKLLPGIRGSWRTHMNALQRVVEQNLTTAIILEDDVDWDIRVRQNLQRFALASRFLSNQHRDLPTNLKKQIKQTPNSETEETAYKIIDIFNLAKLLPSLPLSSTYNPTPPKYTPSSPYGDPSTWDILWLGHCGTGMPRPHPNTTPSTNTNLVLTHHPDPTVPSPQHLKAHPFQGQPDALATTYPPHTRIYHRATGATLCTVAYAVSQRGARRLLHQFGVKAWNGIFDAELGRWCAGVYPDSAPRAVGTFGAAAGTRQREEERERDIRGRRAHGRRDEDAVKNNPDNRLCLTTQPPIFAHHHPAKGESDIGGLGGGYARRYETKYLRYSVRMNLEGLVESAARDEGGSGRGMDSGVGVGLVDQWPDVDDDDGGREGV